MYVGVLTLDLLLGDVASLKQKRSAIRPLVAELRRRYPAASVAETGYLDRHRRAELGIAVASSTAAHAIKVLTACGRLVAEMLERRIKDPRLGFVTVTDVRLTGDLRDATVYYTVYGPADERAAS